MTTLAPSPTIGSAYAPYVGGAVESPSGSVVSAASTSAAATAPATSTVKLSTVAASDALTYSAAGVMRSASKQPVWESATGDATSNLMAANLRKGGLAGSWSDLGRALLDGLGNGGGNYSQSVLVSNEAMQGSSGVQGIVRDQLHRFAANSIGLSVVTAGGAKINISLSADDKGIAVKVDVAEGKLDSDARAALAQLGDGFQAAIDGLAEQPPRLALDKLMQFKGSALTSIDLHASLGADSQVIDLHTDATTRKLSSKGSAGRMEVAVDLAHPAITGSAAQQQRAISSYLQQFDAAVQRGHGDAGLASLFKDGFAQLNSHYPGQSSSTPAAVVPSEFDQQLLTGLADFSASISQAADSPNPLRRDEIDSFDYRVSQQTTVSGHSLAERGIVQQQQSSLRAAWHQSLQPDLPLRLGTDAKSQNYTYHQVDDQASSKMEIGYRRGYLVKAQLSQSARQDTQVSKYVEGKLVQDTRTPLQSAIVHDFAAQLQQGLAAGRDRASGSQANWRQLLAQIGRQALLQQDPTQLKLQAGALALSQDAA